MIDFFNKKKLLVSSKRKYTLTVVTSPDNAVCVMTINGISYTTKSVKVEEGTYITVTVSYSGTTTKTYSLELNNNTTLTFTRTSSSSTSIETWTQPTLTANGTLGSGSFAVDGTHAGNYGPAYKCTVPSAATSGFVCMFTYNTYITLWFNPAVKISTIKIRNCNGNSGGSRGMFKGTFGYSNNNSSYTSTEFANSNTTPSGEWDIAVNMPNYYHYFRLTCTAASSGNTNQFCINRMLINAVYQKITTTYYFNVSVS